MANKDSYVHALDVTQLVKIPDTRKRYGSLTGYYWDVGKKGSQLRIYVDPVHLYDFDVSVPRGVEWLFDPHNIDHLVAAGIHDKLLEEGYDPAFASAEFRRVLRARGVPAKTAWKAFFGTLWHTAFNKRTAVLTVAIFLLWSILWPVAALAQEPVVEPVEQHAVALYTYEARVTHTYDADTWTMDIDLGFNIWVKEEDIRLYAVNTQEIKKSKAKGITAADVQDGYACRDAALRLMGLNPLEYRRIARKQSIRGPPTVVIETFYETEGTGKYGRTLAIVWVPTENGLVNLNDYLVSTGCSKIELYNGRTYPEGTLIRRTLE